MQKGTLSQQFGPERIKKLEDLGFSWGKFRPNTWKEKETTDDEEDTKYDVDECDWAESLDA